MFFLRSPERRQYQLLSDQRRHSAPDSFRFLKLPMLEPLVESRRLKENQRQDNSLLSPRSPGGSHPFGVPNGPTGKCLSQNVFLKMYFSKCISQNVFLKMYLVCQMDQQESVFLKMYFSKCIPQNVFGVPNGPTGKSTDTSRYIQSATGGAIPGPKVQLKYNQEKRTRALEI